MFLRGLKIVVTTLRIVLLVILALCWKKGSFSCLVLESHVRSHLKNTVYDHLSQSEIAIQPFTQIETHGGWGRLCFGL